MIKVPAIEGKNNGKKAESIPDKFFGSYSDDNFFYFFESDQERIDFMNALPKAPPVVSKSELVTYFQNLSPEDLQTIKNILK